MRCVHSPFFNGSNTLEHTLGRNHISEPKVAKLFHILVHLYSIQEHKQGNRLFKCRHCDKAFAQNCNLWDHIRMHTGEKPFTCSRCGKSSSQKSHLKNHMRIHTGEKFYQSSVSGNSNPMSHMRTHRKEAISVQSMW